LGAETDSDIRALFAENPHAKAHLDATFLKDHAKTADESYLEIHKRLRDGEVGTVENAKEFIRTIFSEERYDISKVGRFRFNKRFGKPTEGKGADRRTINIEDIATVVNNIINLNNTPDAFEDDIDHLGSRRARFVGELLQQRIRVGMTQIKRNIQDRMSTIDQSVTMPMQFISPKPLQARIKEFFNTNQLSQFMLQENILSEMEHLRTLSALGPGGLTRERAGFEVRDVRPHT
jgi:DNA-directed RNA polymerase subunit beta